MSRNDNEPFCSISDVKEMFLCCLLRYFLIFFTCSVESTVDNTFLLFRSTEHVEKFKKYLNKQHKNIYFTSEMEQNGSLSFLDIKINGKNNKFITSVYRKPTFSEVFPNIKLLFPITINAV